MTSSTSPAPWPLPPADVVVVSCMDQLGWAVPLATAGLQVLVLEKCANLRDDLGRPVAAGSTSARRKVGKSKAQRPKQLQYVEVANCGREAHAYIWYIVEAWDRLREQTVFLQGDAHHHLEPALMARLAAVVLELRASPRPPSFLPLCGGAVPSSMWSAAGLADHCELFRNFSRPEPWPEPRPAPRSQPQSERPCQVWSSTTHAHFVVSRQAIRRHSRRSYRTMLRRLFESGDGACVRRDAATFLERSWNLIFGCARMLGCTFTERTTQAEFEKQCPFSNERMRLRVDGTLDTSQHWPHAEGPEAPVGGAGAWDRSMARLREPDRRLPVLADALASMPSWENAASRTLLSGACWGQQNRSARDRGARAMRHGPV